MKKLLLAACAATVIWGGAAQAVVTVTQTPVFPQIPRQWKWQMLPAGTTVATTFITPGPNGSIIKSIVCTNNDSAQAQVVQFNVLRSTISYLLGSVNVPLSSGNTAAAVPVNALAPTVIPGLPVDSDGNPYIYLEGTNAAAGTPAGADVLQASVTVTVNTGKATSCFATGADF